MQFLYKNKLIFQFEKCLWLKMFFCLALLTLQPQHDNPCQNISFICRHYLCDHLIIFNDMRYDTMKNS